MNRFQRRASGLWTVQQERRVAAHAQINAAHWAEIRRIKREYDALTPDEQAEQKPILAYEIDQHLAALIAN